MTNVYNLNKVSFAFEFDVKESYMCVFSYVTNSRVSWCICTHVLQESIITRSGASSNSLTLSCFSKWWYPLILPLLATVR